MLILLIDICVKERKIHFHTKTRTEMFTKTYSQHLKTGTIQMPVTDELINILWHIHTQQQQE